MINTPYVKQYDENGVLTNPIIGRYTSEFKNRHSRRSIMQKDRFFGNGKNVHLTVTKTGRYKRVKQCINLKLGGVRTLMHYVLYEPLKSK